MSPRQFVLVVFGALVALSVVAWLSRSNPDLEGRVPLIWTTDPNPARDLQLQIFNEMNPDCFVTVDPDSGDAMKIMVQCSANMGPDMIDHIYYDTTLQTYVDAGILLDVTDVAEELGFGLSTLAETVRPLVMSRVLTEDGDIEWRQFTYPANVFGQFILYNKDVFRAIGMPEGPPPDMTWEEFIEIAQSINAPGSSPSTRRYGAAGLTYEKLMFDAGAHWFNEWGTVCTLDSEEAIKAFRFYHDLIYKFKAEPTPEEQKSTSSSGGWGGGYMTWFGEGRLGMLWGARWMLIRLRQIQREQQKAREEWFAKNPNGNPEDAPKVLEIGAVHVPRPEGGPRYTLFNARCTGVNAQGKHIEDSLKFLSYLATREYAEVLDIEADSNPGNQAFYNMDFFMQNALPGEDDVHRLAIEVIPFGKTRESSPFVPNATVNRSILKVTDKITNTPNLTDAELRNLMEKCAYEINLTLARNINREPRLKRFYEAMLKEGAEPIKYEDVR